jgi:hypothetical protein
MPYARICNHPVPKKPFSTNVFISQLIAIIGIEPIIIVEYDFSIFFHIKYHTPFIYNFNLRISTTKNKSCKNSLV